MVSKLGFGDGAGDVWGALLFVCPYKFRLRLLERFPARLTKFFATR
jgi:hypothetical protein